MEEKEEERQLRPLHPGGFVPHTGVYRVGVLEVDGDMGTGMKIAVPL